MGLMFFSLVAKIKYKKIVVKTPRHVILREIYKPLRIRIQPSVLRAPQFVCGILPITRVGKSAKLFSLND